MSFSDEVVSKVWAKATSVSEENEKWGFRQDTCGAWIKRSDYGRRDTEWGWEVDHIDAQADGGGDELRNLRPLHWKNNAAKSDGQPKCVVISNGPKNIDV